MRNMFDALPRLLPLLLLAGCGLILAVPASGRTLFYMASALSSLLCLHALWQRERMKPGAAWLLLSLLAFVAYRAFWGWHFPEPADAGLAEIARSYDYAVKIWACALPIVALALWKRAAWSLPRGWVALAMCLLSASLALAMLWGWDFRQGSMTRATLGDMPQTVAVYILVPIHLYALLLLARSPLRAWHWGAGIGLVALQFISVIATGTRAAMIAYPLALGAGMLWRFGRCLHWRGFAVLLLALLPVLWLGGNMLAGRIDEAKADLHAYGQGNADTSIGIRFSLWQEGIASLQTHPWGQSIQSRDDLAHSLIKARELNGAALSMRTVHLHNELLEIASLQGIPGVLLWLGMLAGLLFYGWRGGADLKAFVVLFIACWLFFGLSDVLILSPQISMFGLMFLALGLYIGSMQAEGAPAQSASVR